MLKKIYSFNQERADNTALLYKGKSISYKELNQRIQGFACYLENKDISEGDSVIIALDNCPEIIYSLFGAWENRITVVPLDYRLTATEYKAIIKEVKPKLVVTSRNCNDGETYKRFSEMVGNSKFEKELVVIDCDAFFNTNDNFDFAHSLLSDSKLMNNFMESSTKDLKENANKSVGTFMAMIQYTSGTMGKPKGVMKKSRQFLYEARSVATSLKYTSKDKIMIAVPLYHAYGFGDGLISGLYAGATLVIGEQFTGRRQLELIKKHKVSVFIGVPFMYKMFNQLFISNEERINVLRLCLSAGAPIDQRTSKEFTEKYNCSVCSLYGSSETNTISVNLEVNENKAYGSVGKPIDGIVISIKDSEGNLLGDNQSGDIWINSRIAGTGYYNNQPLSKQYFVGAEIMTGDTGYINEHGLLFINGRTKNFINVGGEKVDPKEVEDVVMAMDAVGECVVLGTTGAYDEQKVKAVIVKNGALDRQTVISHCNEHLVGFKIPKIIEFRESIPISPTGKIMRKFLV